MCIQIFIGQIMGTSVGTAVFNSHGWRPAAALSVGWQGFCLLILFLRGPHCSRYTWFGYQGGFEMRKKRLQSPAQEETENESEKIEVDAMQNKKSEEPVIGDVPRASTGHSGEKGVVEEKERVSAEC